MVAAGMLGLLLALGLPAQETRTFTITEPVGLDWAPDRVDYRVEFPEGQVAPGGVALKNAAGEPTAVQLSEIDLWPDGKTVKAATVSFIARLKTNEVATWTLTAGTAAVKQPATDLKVSAGKAQIELSSGKVGIRLAGGEARFPKGAAAEAIPAPIQGLRLLDGSWIGKGWWTTDRPCLGYRAELLENGPVFARVKLSYDFTDRTFYEAIVELNAGAEFAQIREEFNLSEGKAYAMPEQPGEDKTRLYRYVYPRFDNPGGANHWDWWGGTHGKVTAPNGYQFSVYEGLKPDRREGCASRGFEAEPPLDFAHDRRLVNLNAWMNWGQDERVAIGAYNSANPAAGQVSVIGLRPSQWLHPDLDPSPSKTINHFVQANNLWLEQRATPDLFLRVPTCLGKRMYGLGVLPRRDEVRKDKDGKEETGSVSDLWLRHLRLGKVRLDDVKDWIVYWDEPGPFPRLSVKPGDLQGLKERVKNNGVERGDSLNPAVTYLAKPGPETAKGLIDWITGRVRSLAHGVLAGDVDRNAYAMWFSQWPPNVDVALAIPEITPEQRRELLRLVAVHGYLTASPDFEARREHGFGWGSINMPVAVRTGNALCAAMMPNHPHAAAWRKEMATYFSTELLIRSNPAGATEEVGAYGGATPNSTALALGALQRSDSTLDLGPAIERMKAVANCRLQYLSPHDVRMGFRPATPIGDSAYSGEDTFPLLWSFLSQSAPEVGAHLLWGMRETGCKPEGGWTPTSLYADFSGNATPPSLRSEHLAGAGMIMRNGFPAREETYVNINAGSYSVGHGHMDRGCFVLYAKGAPLMCDFGSQYQPSMRLTWNHNGGITFDHDETIRKLGGMKSEKSWFNNKRTKPPKDYEIEPFTCLMPGQDPRASDFEEVFGRVTAFTSLPTADYGVYEQKMSYLVRVPYMTEAVHGQQWLVDIGCEEPVYLKQPFMLTRQYVLVKSPDPAGPNYLVIRDRMPDNADLKPALNFWGLADKLEVNGPRATYIGQHGVDLDLYVAEPARFTHTTHKLSQENPRSFGEYHKQTFGKPFREEQTLFQIPQQPGGGFFTCLVPRKAGEPAPKFETGLDGDGIRVTFADGRVDTVVLAAKAGEYKVEGKTLSGDAFVVTRTAQGVKVTVLGAGSVE
jgi:hypothetical protein